MSKQKQPVAKRPAMKPVEAWAIMKHDGDLYGLDVPALFPSQERAERFSLPGDTPKRVTIIVED